MTTIEFLGHSGIAVENAGRLMLCDPWLSPHGAYNASWFQYPEYPAHGFARLLRPDAVYVSHESSSTTPSSRSRSHPTSWSVSPCRHTTAPRTGSTRAH